MLNGLGGHLISCFILAGLTSPASSNKTQIHQNRDIFSDPANDTDTGLTCYTCVNVSDNLMCNQFAIDHPCPKVLNIHIFQRELRHPQCTDPVILPRNDKRRSSVDLNIEDDGAPVETYYVCLILQLHLSGGQNFCHTLHIMDSTGASVVVNKKCANSSECWPLGVGCVLIDAQKVCVACCDEMYCNVTVPTNQSTAVYSQKRTKPRPTIAPSNSSPSLMRLTSVSLLLSLLLTMQSFTMF